MRLSFISLLASAVAALADHGAAHAQIEQGDRAWVLRAEVMDDRLASPVRIEEAIFYYRATLEADPSSLEARWKLLRALHFAIDFTSLGDQAKNSQVADAIELASTSIQVLEAGGVTESERARLFFWSAIAWGTRAQRVGLLTIVREGAAGRMYDYAEQSLALDPSVDQGGALRLLSRLHATLPRVPFVSGWVDRDKALPLAERGYALNPAHPGSRLILALALLDQAPDRRSEARELLESVADSEARTGFLVEDLAIREQAREQLSALYGDAR
jgi:tetratricopeptide (TPR) repeat protein